MTLTALCIVLSVTGGVLCGPPVQPDPAQRGAGRVPPVSAREGGDTDARDVQ